MTVGSGLMDWLWTILEFIPIPLPMPAHWQESIINILVIHSHGLMGTPIAHQIIQQHLPLQVAQQMVVIRLSL